MSNSCARLPQLTPDQPQDFLVSPERTAASHEAKLGYVTPRAQ